MHNDVAWQLFTQSGQPIANKGALYTEVDQDSSLIVAAAHVWFWRKTKSNDIEILIQKRSKHVATWPSYYDISVAGHIDVGEQPIETAVREAQEEVGIKLEPDQLYFLCTLRSNLEKILQFNFVYMHEFNSLDQFDFSDGEVEKLEWLSLDKFEEMTHDTKTYNMVPQGDRYFSIITDFLKAQILK